MNPTFFRTGSNCWRVERAERVAVLVDGSHYFAALAKAIRQAERSILIVGWDFDGRVILEPGIGDGASIGTLLRERVERCPELEVRILIWSVAILHAPSSPSELLWGGDWQAHPRIHLRLDRTHPIYGAHHQKLICVDGALAFAGGMDVTVDRWDTPCHRIDEPDRLTPDGRTYGPVHDIQMLVDGDAARALCDLGTTRWREATGEKLPVAPACADRWIAGVEPDISGADIAITRVSPRWGTIRRPHCEAPQMLKDALRAARTSIFIETQYFTAPYVGRILGRRLAEPDGPEIIVIASQAAHSPIERWIMGENRDRLIRRLRRADRHGRLAVLHPVVADDARQASILIHSKLLIIDDWFLRIGSSNLNNRSVGLDTELDLAIVAASDAHRRAVAAIRGRIIGEHVGVDAASFLRIAAREGSIIRAIEACPSSGRRLEPFPGSREGPIEPVMGTWLLDPIRRLGSAMPWPFSRT